jgi:ferredoxin-type protein NapG
MNDTEGLSRRRFIQIAGVAAGLTGFGGCVRLIEGDKEFLRPPGALEKDDFTARCIRCQKCLQVCHTRVIVPVSLFDGISNVSTPTINFRYGYCDLCMDCVDVCPTGAIKAIPKRDVKIGVAKVIKDTCIAWDWGGCVRCSLKCPYGAITLDDKKRPVVDEEKCNGCGICEYICPSSSLRAYDSKKESKGIIVVPVGEAKKELGK